MSHNVGREGAVGVDVVQMHRREMRVSGRALQQSSHRATEVSAAHPALRGWKPPHTVGHTAPVTQHQSIGESPRPVPQDAHLSSLPSPAPALSCSRTRFGHPSTAGDTPQLLHQHAWLRGGQCFVTVLLCLWPWLQVRYTQEAQVAGMHVSEVAL